jgi:hypothetical protein
MRKYEDDDERKIRAERQVREWTQSGVLNQSQQEQIAPELKVNLRRTNSFLRLVLFGFAFLVLLATVLFIGLLTKLPASGFAILAGFASVGCFLLAEFLIEDHRLYRFGIEEAAAIGSAFLLSVAAGLFTIELRGSGLGQAPLIVGLIVGSGSAFVIYLRFGFVYAAIASMICLSAMPFQTGMSEMAARLTASGLLGIVFIVTRSKRREYGDEFPGDEYGALQAIAWVGVYAFLNLQVTSFVHYFAIEDVPRPFYWFTYVLTWALPALGLYLAIRQKDRPLLDASLVLVLVTLATNKPYLGSERASWDPILLGVLLIGVAVLLRRWLAGGEGGFRHGFTADRLLSSDKRALAVVGTGSAALHSIGQMPLHPGSSAETFKSGDGRSGGAGASGSF